MFQQTERTRRELREAMRAEVSRELRGALYRHDFTQEAIAAASGANESKGARWVNPNCPEVPGVSDVALMPRDVALDLLRWACDAHGVQVVDRIESGSVSDHMRHLHTLIREGSDVTAAYAMALADGIIDGAERQALITELDEDIAAKSALRQVLLEADRAEREAIAGAPRRIRRVL